MRKISPKIPVERLLRLAPWALLIIPVFFVLYVLSAIYIAPTLIPAFSPLLPKPSGVPHQARAAYDWKGNAIRWRFCVNTDNGHAWIERSHGSWVVVTNGIKCDEINLYSTSGRVTIGLYPLVFSRPYILVASQYQLMDMPCRVKPSPVAFRQAALVVKEISSHASFTSEERMSLLRQAPFVAAMAGQDLWITGFRGSGQVICSTKR